ncbi:MAG: hypothetical protein A3J65_00945 [Candidatus Buchananbacteria bacterium RIFCSPHIGHO2_02_FULL_45_11b]|uniref:DUF3105 domain-containing protein n=3 Tax=Candidatus Buchananiibacteriota TaxID=1817903 RepID=A0A1G1Y515_9BACT|nr:MAG: hypothetical protein A2663_04115 [Candidatus Buchananbacteria bacterium RIFCSPHIGHO2_01_FULL_46_12]OGY52092.1 MAG: hypothetical protein A3J65_00945 [Candidatus Buchananbacteria bacterium RIFCSPHIGHO2_02_FULL_45_11b]OGY57447.1 MAG: hypothetical protein A3H67_02225 [Candidatus Buchananbacteria bacterium RIFCSPLOWO2_02_FULL_46_11b]
MNNEISNEPLSKHDRQERRRQEKEAERRARKKARSARAFRNYAMAVLVIAAAASGIYLLAKSAAPKEEDFSRAIPVMEASHIAAGSRLPEYTSNPPTSGPHYSQTARSGFRDEAIPDQNIIHNLEHGDIWIAYHPRLADEIKEELKQFGAAKVIITPREANETDIALAAWGRLDTFNLDGKALPVERITDFIKRYANQGPEKVPQASGGI